jgi:NYN domain
LLSLIENRQSQQYRQVEHGVDRSLAQFYYTVQQAGFTVNLYQMEGGLQKQADVALASNAIWRATQGDTIILSSGDIDFLPAVKLITENGCQKLILFTYDFGVHEELISAASEHWMFENYPQLERG